jgi:hypothetical protein
MRPTLPLLRLRLLASASTRTHSVPNSLVWRPSLLPIDRVSHCSASVFDRNISGPRRKTLHSQHSGRHHRTATHSSPHISRVLAASSSSLLGLVLLFSIGLGFGFVAVDLRRRDTLDGIPDRLIEDLETMSGEIAPGRPGNLTLEEEEKLRRLWQLVFQVCGVAPAENGTAVAPNSAPAPAAASPVEKSPKKGRMSIFSRRGRKESDPVESAAPAPSGPPPSVVLSPPKEGDHDKYGQTQHFYDTLASMTPESIRATIWSMVKHDHPDALLLRFLRARKWDVEKALIMMISTMSWRANEMKVDEDIMRNGDAAAAEAEKNATDPAEKRLGHDFLQQARIGKSFIHGVDKTGRPVCYVRVRLHKQGEQVEKSLERYTVYVIETCRYLLQPPTDTAVSETPLRREPRH